MFEASFLNFVARHGETLTSLSIPIGYGPLNRRTLDFVLKAIASAPKLKYLTLVQIFPGHGGRRENALQFLTELTTALASPKYEIERYDIGDIGLPFSPSVGKLFAACKSLKFLRLGDCDNTSGPYGYDGRLDFIAYGSVSQLPPLSSDAPQTRLTDGF